MLMGVGKVEMLALMAMVAQKIQLHICVLSESRKQFLYGGRQQHRNKSCQQLVDQTLEEVGRGAHQ